MATKDVVPPNRPPAALYTLTEGSRAVSEYVSLYAAKRFLGSAEAGDGRPVLVLPGLMAGDATTKPMRRILAQRGFTPYGWGLGANVGPTSRVLAGLDALLDRVTDEHGAPVSLVGWSLGGMLARDLAVRHPGRVDRLIALGTPFGITDDRQSRAGLIYNLCARFHVPEYVFDSWKSQQIPDSIPATSIYTRYDGIVRWETCLLPPAPRWENVEVVGSHNGLGFNALALRVVLDQLSVGVDAWHPFRRPDHLRWYYPRTAA